MSHGWWSGTDGLLCPLCRKVFSVLWGGSSLPLSFCFISSILHFKAILSAAFHPPHSPSPPHTHSFLLKAKVSKLSVLVRPSRPPDGNSISDFKAKEEGGRGLQRRLRGQECLLSQRTKGWELGSQHPHNGSKLSSREPSVLFWPLLGPLFVHITKNDKISIFKKYGILRLTETRQCLNFCPVIPTGQKKGR